MLTASQVSYVEIDWSEYDELRVYVLDNDSKSRIVDPTVVLINASPIRHILVSSFIFLND